MYSNSQWMRGRVIFWPIAVCHKFGYTQKIMRLFGRMGPEVHLSSRNLSLRSNFERNWDKRLKGFSSLPFTDSQSPLLTDFLPPPPPLSNSGLKLVWNVNIVYGNLWELSRLCPEASMKLYVDEFGFCTQQGEITRES
jgi:hypothetical protein